MRSLKLKRESYEQHDTVEDIKYTSIQSWGLYSQINRQWNLDISKVKPRQITRILTCCSPYSARSKTKYDFKKLSFFFSPI